MLPFCIITVCGLKLGLEWWSLLRSLAIKLVLITYIHKRMNAPENADSLLSSIFRVSLSSLESKTQGLLTFVKQILKNTTLYGTISQHYYSNDILSLLTFTPFLSMYGSIPFHNLKKKNHLYGMHPRRISPTTLSPLHPCRAKVHLIPTHVFISGL